MSNKEIVESAIKELSKEQQEGEIRKIKEIVKQYLEKIDLKKKEVKEKQDELHALEKDLDDLKSGRLDKIEERQGKDPIHDKVKIIEIRRIEGSYQPYKPWSSPWIVWLDQCYTNSPMWTTCENSTFTGTMFQNFTSGTYQIGDKIINL